MSSEESICPDCGGELRHRDWRPRIVKWYNGKEQRLLIQRLQCPKCHHLHNELPDIITPHKHYATELIENVVDEVSTPDDESTLCSPSERTMERWKQWIRQNRAQIDGHLRSVGVRLFELSYEFLNSDKPLLEELQSYGAGWLPLIIHMIYNSGGRILPSGPPYKYAPVLS